VLGVVNIVFFAGTFLLLVASIFAMQHIDSDYGWYIPTLAALTYQTIVFTVIAFKDEWKLGLVAIPFLLGIVGVVVAGSFLFSELEWYIVLVACNSAAVLTLSVVKKPVLALIGLFLSVFLGALIAEDRGAVIGGGLYGYLVLVGWIIVGRNKRSNDVSNRLRDLVERAVYLGEKSADRYLFSPVLWRILAISRCLPIHSARFFQYAEQALVLKRAAGDIEFMHRLLRDYFALRDLQPLLTATDSGGRSQAIRSLGFQGEAAIDALAEFVRDTNPDSREAAAWALGKVVSPAVLAHLEAALGDPVPKVRRAAVPGVRNLVELEQVRLLSLVVDDQDLSVQRAVIEMISRLGTSKDATPLRKRVVSNIRQREDVRQLIFQMVGSRTEDKTRVFGIRMLSDLNDQNSVPYLASALLDRRFKFREAAAQVLGEFTDPRAVKALRKALTDKDKQVRLAAHRALRRIRVRTQRYPQADDNIDQTLLTE